MKKFNVNIDRPKPSSDEILAHRDFDSLMKQYKAAPGKVIPKPFYKTGWFFGSLATAAAVAVAVIVYINKTDVSANDKPVSPIANNNHINNSNPDSVNQKTIALHSDKQKISPPLKNLDVAFVNYKINSSHGGIITPVSGSKITIPANAFVDAQGNPVNGNVDVKYREFRDQVDIFLSGIPMQYDSAGTTYQFESGGMMEIAAFVNGKVVYLNQNKKVKIEFASAKTNSDFNLYKFDTLAGNWNYLGKDNVVANPKTEEKDTAKPLAVNDNNQWNNWEGHDNLVEKPMEPIKPIKADKHKNRFTVAVDPKEFPEMSGYKDVVFEVDETRTPFKRDYYKTIWESVVARKGTDGSKDVLTLTRGNQIVTLDVYPVLDGENYDHAIAHYNDQYAEYQKQLTEFNNAMAQRNNVGQTGNDFVKLSPEQLAKKSKAEKEWYKAAEVLHVFEVASFGIYNMDMIAQLPHGSTIDLNVNDANSKIFSGFTCMYHIDRGKVSLYSYHNENPLTGFKFNRASSNLIWAMKDGELYYADNDQFTRLPSSGSGNVVLKTIGKEFKSPEEMKKFFKIGK